MHWFQWSKIESLQFKNRRALLSWVLLPGSPIPWVSFCQQNKSSICGRPTPLVWQRCAQQGHQIAHTQTHHCSTQPSVKEVSLCLGWAVCREGEDWGREDQGGGPGCTGACRERAVGDYQLQQLRQYPPCPPPVSCAPLGPFGLEPPKEPGWGSQYIYKNLVNFPSCHHPWPTHKMLRRLHQHHSTLQASGEQGWANRCRILSCEGEARNGQSAL